MNIKPLADRVVIKPKQEDDEKKTESGIIIPETVDKEKPQEGEVVAVGKGRVNENGDLLPMEISVGDKVVFSKFGPDEVQVNGEEYMIVKESDILAVIK